MFKTYLISIKYTNEIKVLTHRLFAICLALYKNAIVIYDLILIKKKKNCLYVYIQTNKIYRLNGLMFLT